jgi:hypothetical protein
VKGRIVRALTGWPSLGFNQVVFRVNAVGPPASRQSIRRSLDRLVKRGVVGEDVAPGLAAYYLRGEGGNTPSGSGSGTSSGSRFAKRK